MIRIRKHLVLATLVGLGLRLFFVWRFPTNAGDTAVYEELARNWLDHRVYGLFLDGQLTPVDLRAPGYPAFLAAIYALFGRTRLAILLAQTALDLTTCFLTAVLARCLAPQVLSRRVTIAGMWLAATCPFSANYTAVPLTEILASFLTAAALLAFLTPWRATGARLGEQHFALPLSNWFLGGVLVGLGALVRPETPLILAAVALVHVLRWRRPADWPKLVRAGALTAAGLLVVLMPWAARNWHTLHRVQLLAPRYAQMPAEYVPRGFYAWTNTWLVRFRDVYLVLWKLEAAPIQFEDLPTTAFDSTEERAQVAALLETYNATLSMPAELDHEFAQIAAARTSRHPLRTYLWVPVDRMATLWFTPRLELLPYSGRLWPPGKRWEEDPQDFCVTVGLGLLNFFYAGLALAGACLTALRTENKESRQHFALTLLVAFILVRTVFLTQIETPEPRYVLECFPAALALAAQVWAKPHASTAA